MEPVGWAVLVLVVSTVGVAVSVRRGHAPGEKRTYAFETETGERDNPFSDLSAGAENSDRACRQCGTGLSAAAYDYCTTCSLAD
jgi:hypothetical protein